MFYLSAKISGDATPIIDSFKKVEKAAKSSGTSAGQHFGNEFKSTMLRFIGAGAIISQVNRLVQQAVQIEAGAMREGLGIEAFQEMQRLAEMTGRSIKELRESGGINSEVAEKLASALEAVRASGGILDSSTVQQLAEAAYEFRQATRAIAPVLSGALRLFNITREIGQRGMEATAGTWMTLMGGVFGNRPDWMETGAGIVRDAFTTPLESPSGNVRLAAERSAARELSDALHRSQQAEALMKAQLEELKKSNATQEGIKKELADAL